MAHQDFHDRLARLNAQAPIQGQSAAPAARNNTAAERPAGAWDIVMSLVLGIAASFAADMVELHIAAEGSALRFLNGDGWLYGLGALVAIVYVGIHLLRLKGFMVTPMLVAGIFTSTAFVGHMAYFAPDLVALAYTPDYIALLGEGYSHQGFLSDLF